MMGNQEMTVLWTAAVSRDFASVDEVSKFIPIIRACKDSGNLVMKVIRVGTALCHVALSFVNASFSIMPSMTIR